jgi:hypothetical protein
MMRALNDQFRRIEALKLYRDILRTSRLFTWTDENGVSWGEMLKLSAREEFECSKQENDPEILARALVNGRMALDDVVDKYRKQQENFENQFTQHVEATRVDRNRGVAIREHEIFDRQYDPNTSPSRNPLFHNVDLSQFNVHPSMYEDEPPTPTPQQQQDNNQSIDIYAAAMRNLRNKKNA